MPGSEAGVAAMWEAWGRGEAGVSTSAIEEAGPFCFFAFIRRRPHEWPIFLSAEARLEGDNPINYGEDNVRVFFSSRDSIRYLSLQLKHSQPNYPQACDASLACFSRVHDLLPNHAIFSSNHVQTKQPPITYKGSRDPCLPPRSLPHARPHRHL